MTTRNEYTEAMMNPGLVVLAERLVDERLGGSYRIGNPTDATTLAMLMNEELLEDDRGARVTPEQVNNYMLSKSSRDVN